MPATTESYICFLRLPEVKHRTGLSRSSIYAKIPSGDFPPPVSLGGRAVGWLENEVSDWMAERIRASRASPGSTPCNAR